VNSLNPGETTLLFLSHKKAKPAGGWISRDIPGECRVRRQIAYLRKGEDANPKSAPPFGVWLWMSGGANPQLGICRYGDIPPLFFQLLSSS
jgi:hypothetical protein